MNKKMKETLGEAGESLPLGTENLLDLKADLTCSKSFGKKGKFTFEIPNPSVRLEIGRRIGAYFGMPIERVPITDLTIARVIVTLDIILTDYPEWWPGALKVYDTDFLMKLYTWFLEEDTRLKEKLKKNKLGAIRAEEQE